MNPMNMGESSAYRVFVREPPAPRATAFAVRTINLAGKALDVSTLTGDMNVTIALTEDVTNGVFFGLQSISYIPEPATATLSLLALAGLAARRRRK